VKEPSRIKSDRILEIQFRVRNDFFSFLLDFKVRFLMQYDSMMPYNISVLYVPH
jgi:hypothetical protein